MPVNLPQGDIEELWLDPSIDDLGALGNVLVPNTEDAMEACEVPILVNSATNDSPEVIGQIA